MSEIPRHSPLTIAGLWIRRSADSAVTIPLRMSRQFTQDFRYSLRLWARRPLHTGFAILALAIGIGANTGVFSVVNALLLRSLPFHDPSRLASLGSFFPPHGSAKDFHEWRQQQSSYLADAALVEETDLNLWGGRAAERAHVSQASWNFFSTLGVQPALGRGFLPGEDTPGQNAIAVVSFGLWQEYFAGDQRVLGSTIRINDVPLTIVGVAPRGFDYPNGSVLWKAAAFSPGNNGWETIARLKSGITWPRARSAFAVEADRLWPQRNELGNTEHVPNMTSLQDGLAGPVKNASLMLMAGVVLILLIACANVANLLMARTWDRAAELSIRSALGASRARLAQQLLTECLLLSFVSAIAGLILASWTTSIATRLQPPPLASQSFSILDGRVLGFVALASILSCALFGVLPSLYAGRTYLFGTRSSAKGHGSRLVRESLVAAQIMLTIILFTASVSVARAFINLMSTERGFDVKALATVSVSLEGTTHQSAQKQLTYLEEVLDRIRRIPGVRYASATQFLPLYATGFVGGPFTIDGRPFQWNSTRIPVLSDYFQTMGGHILYGREFTEAEVRSGSKVAVINERFASEFGAPADALGRQLTSGNNPPRKIIGIVKGINYVADPTAGWRPTAETREVYVPASEPSGFRTSFVVRVNGRAEELPWNRPRYDSVGGRSSSYIRRENDGTAPGRGAGPAEYLPHIGSVLRRICPAARGNRHLRNRFLCRRPADQGNGRAFGSRGHASPAPGEPACTGPADNSCRCDSRIDWSAIFRTPSRKPHLWREVHRSRDFHFHYSAYCCSCIDKHLGRHPPHCHPGHHGDPAQRVAPRWSEISACE